MKENRPPPARQTTCRAFQNPVFLEKFFDDHGNRAALHSGQTCKIGARYGLALSDQIQHNPPVDIANNFIRRRLRASGISGMVHIILQPAGSWRKTTERILTTAPSRRPDA